MAGRMTFRVCILVGYVCRLVIDSHTHRINYGCLLRESGTISILFVNEASNGCTNLYSPIRAMLSKILAALNFGCTVLLTVLCIMCTDVLHDICIIDRVHL